MMYFMKGNESFLTPKVVGSHGHFDGSGIFLQELDDSKLLIIMPVSGEVGHENIGRKLKEEQFFKIGGRA